jgi:hypothetical protein
MVFRSEGGRGRDEWAFREESTGREVVFSDVKLTPLSYNDLVDAKSNKTLAVPLEWRNAKVLRSEIPGIEAGQFGSVNTALDSNFKSKGIGLVRGGWLPSGLAVNGDMVVLLDRCILVDLIGRFNDGVKRRDEDRDLLDLFNTPGIRINPLLYALEGPAQENPTLEVVEDQIEWAARKLRAALPKATLVATNKLGLRGLMGIISETQTSMARKERFLLRLAPQIAAPVSSVKRERGPSRAPSWPTLEGRCTTSNRRRAPPSKCSTPTAPWRRLAGAGLVGFGALAGAVSRQMVRPRGLFLRATQHIGTQ